MKDIHHAAAVTTVPAGFCGWWCQRCERAVVLSEELGSPAKCPRCHKPTAVWVPPAAVESPELRVERPEDPGGRYVGPKRSKEYFAQMREFVDGKRDVTDFGSVADGPLGDGGEQG